MVQASMDVDAQLHVVQWILLTLSWKEEYPVWKLRVGFRHPFPWKQRVVSFGEFAYFRFHEIAKRAFMEVGNP